MTERLRLCCELKEESCGGIHFYEMLKLKQLPKVTIITGNGPLLAIASNLNINLFVFDEHHGWNSVSVLDVEHKIDHLSVKYLSPKRIGDSLSGPLCHLAIASGSLIRFFKVTNSSNLVPLESYIQVIENELRGDFNRYKFHELDGHDFSKKNTTDRHNSTSSNASVPSSSAVPHPDDPEVKIEYLKFVGSQLLAVSENSNKMAVWNAARQGRWQQHSTPEKVLCLESVSTFVYMGSGKGQNIEVKYGQKRIDCRRPRAVPINHCLVKITISTRRCDLNVLNTCKNRNWSDPLHRFAKISAENKR